MVEPFTIVRRGDVRLCTQSFGDPQDPALLLIMGATASMMWWPDRLCRDLAAAGRHVIRFDHRDTGGSTTVAPGEAAYDFEDMVDDTVAILLAYGIGQAHLVGMSLGGLIAQAIAQRDPGLVRTLTLIAAEPLGGEPVDAPAIDPALLAHFGTMDSVDWKDGDEVTRFLTRIAELSVATDRGVDRSLSEDRIAREIDRSESLHSAFNHASLDGDFVRWDPHAIKVPTLVLHGAHDRVLPPANAEAIARQVPGAKLHLLTDAGHELHGDDLPEITALILAHTR